MGGLACDLCTWEVQGEAVVIPLHNKLKATLGYPTPCLEETKDKNETEGPEKELGAHNC